MIKITVCMGSSCFTRGNAVNADLIRQFVASHKLEDKIRVEGCLCEGKCKQGPNITINGKLFSQVSPEGLEELLKKELEIT
jgi:NADH:ubiquinone oxidoreductase subunit E